MQCPNCCYNLTSGSMSVPYIQKDNIILASLGERFCGTVLDILGVFLCFCGVVFITTVIESLTNITFIKILAYPTEYFILLYPLIADGLKEGQSYGKRIMKTSVVDATTGEPCTFWKSFIRNFFMVLGLFDLVFIFGEKRQRLGDKAANTIVIKMRIDPPPYL